MKLYQKILTIIAIVLVLAGIGYLVYGYVKTATTKVQNPVATIEVKDFGTIKVELYPDKAPNTVANFIALSNNGFYDNLTFHRTIPDFMIQGGNKTGDGKGTPTLSSIDKSIESSSTGDTEYNIEGEFIANGYTKNTVKFEKGVIAMGRLDYSQLNSEEATKGGYNSAGSDFFIMNADNNNLNGLYAGFGKVIEGLDIVDKIANVDVVTRDSSATEGLDKPVNPPVITSIKVETYGVNYGKPKTVTPFNYYNWMLQNYYSGSSTSTNN